jgi:hypothetical protein
VPPPADVGYLCGWRTAWTVPLPSRTWRKAILPLPAMPKAPPRSRARGCLLAGCLALLVLAVVPPLLLFSFASEGFAIDLTGPPGRWEEAERSHPLPGAPPPADEEGVTAGAAGGELPLDAPTPGTDAAAAGGGELAVAGAGRGRIVLDVSLADLHLVPVASGAPLRLVASYDETRFRLEESLDEDGDDWTYRLRLRSRGLRGWWNNNSNSTSRLRLEVPRGMALTLEGKVGIGASELELGGLTLGAIDLDLGVGEHQLRFSEPTVGPMALLRLDSSMGELELVGVGNASPRELSIEHGMGELDLDLGGAWRNDGRVELKVGMGESRVRLPGLHEAGGMVVESRVGMGSRHIEDVAEADLPEGLPRVRIHARGGMGNLDVR